MDKPTSAYTVDELLEASQKEVESRATHKMSRSELNDLHVQDFIRRVPIKPGTVKVPRALVLDRYFLWCEEANCKPTTKRKFFKHFDKYFDKFYIKGVTGYKLDPASFGLSMYYSFYRDPRFVKTKTPFGPAPGFKGVYQAAGQYVARFETDNGFKHYLGTYSSVEEAAERYDVEIVNYYGKEEALEKINYPEKAKDYEAYIQETRTEATQIRTTKIPSFKR